MVTTHLVFFSFLEGASLGSAVVVPAAAQPTGGRSRDSRGRKRRFILPDGRVVFTTYAQAYELIEQFAEEKPKNRFAPSKAKKVASVVEAKDVVTFKPLKSDPESFRMKLDPRFVWKPDPETYWKVVQDILEDDEDDLVVFFTLH